MSRHSNDSDFSDDDVPNNSTHQNYRQNWGKVNLNAFDEFKVHNAPPSALEASNNLSAAYADNFELRPRQSPDLYPQTAASETDNDLLDQREKNPHRSRRREAKRRSSGHRDDPWRETQLWSSGESAADGPPQTVPMKVNPGNRKVSFQQNTVQDHQAFHLPNLTKSVDRRQLDDIQQTASPGTAQNGRNHENEAFRPPDKSALYQMKDLGHTNSAYHEAPGDHSASQSAGSHTEDDSSDSESMREVSQYEQLNWDVFRSPPYDPDQYSHQRLYDIVEKSFRVIFVFVSIILILATLVMSKLSLLFATSNLNPSVTFHRTMGECLPPGENSTNYYAGPCTRENGALLTDDQCGVPVKHRDADMHDEHPVRWMWCVWMTLTVPYVITFVHSMWKVCFKHKKTPTFRAVAFVIFMESLHVAGVMILLFFCLPEMDVFRGIFLLNATAIYPAFFKLFLRPAKEQHRSWQIVGDTAAFVLQLSSIVLYIWLAHWSANDHSDTSHYKCSAEQGLDVSHPWLLPTEPELERTTLVFNNTDTTPAYGTNETWHSAFPLVLNDTDTTPAYDTSETWPSLGPFVHANNSTELENPTDINGTFVIADTEPTTFAYNHTETDITGTFVTADTEPTTLAYNHTEYDPYDKERCGPGQENLGEPSVYLIPVGLLLASFGWWQNFLGKELQMSCARQFNKLNREIKNGKTKLYVIVSMWKIALSFALFVLFAIYHSEISVEALFGTDPFTGNSSHFRDPEVIDTSAKQAVILSDWLIVFGANAGAGLLCYIASLHAIQAKTQRGTYSVAVMLATPVSIIVALYGFCFNCSPGGKNMATAFGIDEYYWNCFDGFNTMATLVEKRPMVLVGIIFWVSQVILSRHLWYPKSERLAKPGRIFVKPFYCGILLEQSMAYNRSRHDKTKQQVGDLPLYIDDITPVSRVTKKSRQSRDRFRSIYGEEDHVLMTRSLAQMDEPLFDRPDPTQPMIFVCATMWHETEKEMVQMVKSIMRLDKDQCTRRLTRDFFRVRVPDYYDFEGHIFFDDAFEQYIPGDPLFKVNRFVELYVKVMNSSASSVHQSNVVIPPPEKIPTPYGGRLVYTLPGGNKLVLHLKDKQKIRHKKRWSQVMYMYYLFGYRLWNKPLKRTLKEKVAYNTYVLTLDGDVDFKPDAVIKLVDLMKRNYAVGAACGRIHPEGHGPMVWYQKFEYAISHWLQKSTEHVLGCVLCSPGCFSLFRAAALMDDNIMHTYSRKAETATEHVQYDQGEDRWLCTLMLQRGYRVEYSAAADALTFAPEGFREFFNQRRRWTPSTFANVLDLLRSGRQTASRNQNISFLYIVYQGGLLASSILGPATILLMTVGAFAAVLAIEPIGAFFFVFVPVAVFFILCLIAPSSIQLGFAAILGGLFAIAQMVVLVGIIVSIATDGLCSPSTWFLMLVVGIFLVSAILHPQEFTNILHGIIYFMFIPTMYLLLIIYALCNLHVISWGTREVVQTKTEQERLKQRQVDLAQQAAAGPGKSSGTMNRLFAGMFSSSTTQGKEDGWTMSCGTMCRCLCCPRPGESPTDKALDAINKKVNVLLAKKSSSGTDSSSDEDSPDAPLMGRHRSESSSDSSSVEEPQPDYHDYTDERPYWTTLDDSVERGPVGEIPQEEADFWTHLIKRYLLPIDKDKEREERISKSLKDLRNKAVIAFFLLDMLFIVLIQTLQQFGSDFEEGIENAPLNSLNETPSNPYFLDFQCTNPNSETAETYYIDPIGFAFLLVFGLFLVVQFFGMLFHRLFSLLQIVSSTVVCGKHREDTEAAYIKFAEELTKNIGNNDGESETPSTGMSHRTSLASDNFNPHRMTSAANNAVRRLGAPQTQFATMENSFAKNFLALQKQINLIPDEILEEEAEPLGRARAMSIVVPNPASAEALARKKSIHNDAFIDIARRRSTLFNKERADMIRDRYGPTDREMHKIERKLSKKFAFMASPFLPTNTDNGYHNPYDSYDDHDD